MGFNLHWPKLDVDSTFQRLSQAFSGREPGWQRIRAPGGSDDIADESGGCPLQWSQGRAAAKICGKGRPVCGRSRLQARRLGEIDTEAVAAPLVAAGHFR